MLVLGINVSYKRWTKTELDFVEANYGKISYQMMGCLLNRTKHSIAQAVKRYDLPKINYVLKLWHKIGYTDKEISYKMGISRVCSTRKRIALGLQVNLK
jgi:hypothetical protein